MSLWPLRSRSHRSPPFEGSTQKLMVFRILGTARSNGEGYLTFSGLGDPEGLILHTLRGWEAHPLLLFLN